MSRRILAIAITLSLIVLSASLLQLSPTSAKVAQTNYAGLHVSGPNLVDAAGLPVVLHGVDRSGGEFACVQGSGQWNGPMDQTSISAMLTWKINSVRVPLNEDCWLGINGANPSGSSYQSAVVSYVDLAIQNGLYVIVDLHWTNNGNTLATNQQPMPDASHASAFWSSVATTFKNNGHVIFDLFNEPFPGSGSPSSSDWSCWLNGGTCNGMSYTAVGMQSLVNTVRATGASNLIMLGGLAWSNDLSQWLSHKPSDSANNLAASWHSYNFNACSNSTCWNNVIASVASQVPVITGEMGENDCGSGYISSLMSWLDSHHISYLAWTWNTWDCSSGPALITDYTGTATNFGAGYKAHLASLGGGTNPTATPAKTNTPVPTKTNTPVGSTATKTNTPVPTKTSTPGGPTATFVPPTATKISPTATKAIATATPGGSDPCASPIVITGGGTFSVTTASTCFKYVNTSFVNGGMFSVMKDGTATSDTLKWYGGMDQNATSCANQSSTVSGNGGQLNNFTVAKDANGQMFLIVTGSGSNSVTISIQNWQNGTGCSVKPTVHP